MHIGIYITLFTALCGVYVTGLPTGAPAAACVTMTPLHPGATAQTGTSSHTITAVAEANTVNVTISGTFGGFLLQAREEGKTVPIGTFSNPSSPSKLTECTAAGDSVTHSDAFAGNITSFSVTWTPPSTAVDVQFVATIADVWNVYWISEKSAVYNELARQHPSEWKLSRDMGRMNFGGEREPFNSRSFGRESSGSNKPQKIDDFISECVNGHNKYRSKHGVSPIKHARDLSAFAQKWADHLATTNSFQHSPCTLGGVHLGENIASKQSSGAADYTGSEVVDQWYSEVGKYPFGTADGAMSAGHFSQVVWKGSHEVGFGKAHASGNRSIVVASYRPVGNVLGQHRDNVFRAKYKNPA